MSTDNQVHCIVVTPEKTELDTTCDSMIVPMFDGELGIQHGRAPMVGRLGFGIMKIKLNNGTTEWFVDGGFVQVTREGVYVLTDRLLKPDQINRKEAEADLDRAMTIVSNSTESAALKERTLARFNSRDRWIRTKPRPRPTADTPSASWSTKSLSCACPRSSISPPPRRCCAPGSRSIRR